MMALLMVPAIAAHFAEAFVNSPLLRSSHGGRALCHSRNKVAAPQLPTTRRGCSTFACSRLLMKDPSIAEENPALENGLEGREWQSKLQQLISVANTTSAMGWQNSREDTIGARDRDGTWVTRNDEQMEKVFNALNSTIPRQAPFEWLLSSPTPLLMTLEETLGVEIRLILIPLGQILPPVEHPTGTVVLSKALYGSCDVRQMLGDPRGSKQLREAVRQRISTEGVTLYLGGPCRVYGEATLEDACVILEVALIPSLKITSMKGYVPSNENHEHAALPARVELNEQARYELLTGPGFPGYHEEVETRRQTSAWKEEIEDDQRLDIDVDSLRRNVGGLDEELATIVRRAFATRRLPPGTMSSLGLSHVKGMLLYGPPGCGKTLIAREIARILRARPPKVISGPEILDKWVGEAERNVRALFYESEREWDERGHKSGLHVIIFDEMDALTRTRGSLSGDSSVCSH